MDSKHIILKEIFENPTYHFHIRELARKTKLNPNTIINITKDLEKDKITLKNKKKHLVEINGNPEHKNFVRAKRVFNINQLYNSGLVDFLIDFFNDPEAIVIMGSYSRGEDVEKSDIDIVVISNKKEMPKLEKYEKTLKRTLHLMVLDYKEISSEFHKNLINGIVLHGFLK